MYPKYEPRECARCKKLHICTLSVQCACFDVEITDKVMDYITFHFDDCLCKDCLEELKKNSFKSKFEMNPVNFKRHTK